MAIVWPCPLPVDAYVAAGRKVEVPRPVCPLCAGPLVFWSGYWRHVRASGRCRKMFVPRLRCGPCRVSHALLPAFVLAWRLDVAETVGAVIGQVAGGVCGVRPAAARAGVPDTTARGWVRRFRARAAELGVVFAALAVDLGGEAIRILYIEDNPANIEVVTRFLRSTTNVVLHTAKTGEAGLEAAVRDHPDLILLDMHLPGISGEEVLRRLQTEPATTDIPVAVLSAEAAPGIIRRMLASGVAAYLTKPLDLAELGRLVHSFRTKGHSDAIPGTKPR